MYLVNLVNDNKRYTLHTSSTQLTNEKIEGEIKLGINSIDTLTFAIYPHHASYHQLKQLKSIIEVWNTKTNKLEFVGRVLLVVPKMTNTGLIYSTVTCESELGYLMDSSTRFTEFEGVSVRSFLTAIIDNHNNQVESHKRFLLGNVEATDSITINVEYEKTLDCIKTVLLDNYAYELHVRLDGSVRYLDYVNRIGEEKNTIIGLSKNLVTIEQECDPSEVVTRLIPLGEQLEDSEERLTISSVNNGVDYIDNAEGIAAFGIISNSIVFEDITDATELKTQGELFLKNSCVIKKHKIEALDLSLIGLDFDCFEVGNSYPVFNPLMGINEQLRIIEKTININSPQLSTLTIGNKFESIKDYQLSALKSQQDIKFVSSKVTQALKVVDSTTGNVTNIDKKVNVLIDNVDINENRLKKIIKRLSMEV